MSADVDALRVGGTADYAPVSPRELAGRVDLVASASLTDVLPGYSARDDVDEIPYLVLQFKVTKIHRGNAEGLVTDGSVYLRISQGPISVESGEPSFPIEQFKRSLPAGTKALLFLNPADPLPETPLASLPKSARLAMSPLQGLVIDNCGTLIGGKDDLAPSWETAETVDDIVKMLG